MKRQAGRSPVPPSAGPPLPGDTRGHPWMVGFVDERPAAAAKESWLSGQQEYHTIQSDADLVSFVLFDGKITHKSRP
jgi:hypothetical protein